MTVPAPTVYVYGRMIGNSGELYWLQYVAVGDHHGRAANLAVRAWSGGARIENLLTFDGPGRLWLPGAQEVRESVL